MLMMKTISARLVIVCGLLSGMAAVCVAQTYTPPPPPLTTLPPCPADKDAKKRAKRKDCDPTVYPAETVEKKGKKNGDIDSTQAIPALTPAAQAHPYPGDNSAGIPSAAVPDPVKKPTDTPSAGAAHPYPGDNGKDVPYNPADDPAEKGKPVPPHDPAAEKKAADTQAGKANPFPTGSSPDMPTDSATPASKGDDSSPSSSTSSSPASPDASSSSSSSDDTAASGAGKSPKNPDDDDEDKPNLTDKGSSGRRTLKVIKPQSDTARVDEDLSIAKFYGQSGNYMGAYLRAKDAVKTQPDYPDGHYALGEAAKRLKKNDEAVAEFETYLKLSPDGTEAKAAEKALDELK